MDFFPFFVSYEAFKSPVVLLWCAEIAISEAPAPAPARTGEVRHGVKLCRLRLGRARLSNTHIVIARTYTHKKAQNQDLFKNYNWHASVLACSSTKDGTRAVLIALARFQVFYGLSTMKTTTLPSAL